MAKRRGLWAELQRERARRQRLEQQARRARAQAAVRDARERERAQRARARQAAETEKERKRLYIQERRAEAAEMATEVQDRVAELDAVLTAGTEHRQNVTFASMKRVVDMPPFDPAGLDRPHPEPRWADFAPQPPGFVGRALGGQARYEREEARAKQAFDLERGRHAAAEADRRSRLKQRRDAYERQVAAEAEAVRSHNDEIDRFKRDFRAGDSDAVAQFFTLVLDASLYPEGFPHRTRVIFRPEPRELIVEYELPPQSVIPAERDYKYVQTRDEIDPVARPVKEIKERYARLIAQVALRA